MAIHPAASPSGRRHPRSPSTPSPVAALHESPNHRHDSAVPTSIAAHAMEPNAIRCVPVSTVAAWKNG